MTSAERKEISRGFARERAAMNREYEKKRIAREADYQRQHAAQENKRKLDEAKKNDPALCAFVDFLEQQAQKTREGV